MTFHDNILVIDNSALELWTTCPWKGYAASFLRRRLAADAPALRFGAYVHHALAYRYKMEAFGKPWKHATQMRILERLFVNHPCETESWRNLSMAQKVLLHYNEEFGLETLDILRLPSYYNLPLVEKPFAFVAGTVTVSGVVYTIVYSGRIDLVIRRHGQLFVLDFKTTSRLGDQFWQDAAVMEAQRGYCYAIKECLGEEPTGYIVRAIAVREPTKTGTSIEFKEQTFYTKVPPGQLDEWRANMLTQATTIIYRIQESRFERHHKHCVHKFGVCEFYNVCTLPSSSRGAALFGPEFVESDWSPMYK